MDNAIYTLPRPENETVFAYTPGSREREFLKQEIERQYATEIEIPLIIGGKEVRTGKTIDVTCPHEHSHRFAVCHFGQESDRPCGVISETLCREFLHQR